MTFADYVAHTEADNAYLAWVVAEAARREVAATEVDDSMPEELGVAGVVPEGSDEQFGGGGTGALTP